MLPKQNRIKKEKEFEVIFKKGKSFKNNFLILRFVNNSLKFSRLAVIVSQKVSKKAVERNKIRRRISSVAQDNIKNFKKNIDLIFLVLPKANSKSYLETKNWVLELLKMANIL